jgi:hypothetical protein
MLKLKCSNTLEIKHKPINLLIGYIFQSKNRSMYYAYKVYQ